MKRMTRSVAAGLVWPVMLWMVTLPGCVLAQAGGAAAPPAGKLPEFEVASVKVNHSGTNSTRVNSNDGRLTVDNASLTMLIQMAYSMNQSTDDQLIGLPGWARTERFDLQAKVSDEDAAAIKSLTDEQRGLMLLAVLKDRFKLAAHLETRELPVYALVPAKGGSKLTQAKADDAYAGGLKGPNGAARGGGSLDVRRGELTAQGVPLSSLAAVLTRRLGRPVLDKTGLTGNFDFQLQWTPDDAADAALPANAPPPLLTAVQEQLGLKLEASRGQVPVLVIVHVEEPAAN